ncbi:MAG TPA: STAS domain-containing protein [Candidatus Limnocylindrales bacterium]|nr:STAS domain-containing protein [Candidatus Limnocylindrales bacterium]
MRDNEAEILAEWYKQQLAANTGHGTLREADLREQSRAFLSAFREAVQGGDLQNTRAENWTAVRDFLAEVSRTRARQGFTPAETAAIVFSLKQPLFDALAAAYGSDAAGLVKEIWTATQLLDRLGLLTFEAYQKTREDIIARQQQEMMELSTPVVQLWDGILALPLIGTLDSARTQVVMETLLQQIVQTSASIAIIDITGVATVDTLVAQHLLKTVAAARLMGADCVISGVRPQIAQTIVHLGVELGDVASKATLADAFQLALKRTGRVVSRLSAEGRG